jgi:hypothetical protein
VFIIVVIVVLVIVIIAVIVVVVVLIYLHRRNRLCQKKPVANGGNEYSILLTLFLVSM